MLAVEEVCGIAWIKGHRRESRKRRELRARPFPAVSNKVLNTKRAGASRVGANRRRIPGTKIEITVALRWRLAAPGIKALFLALRCAIRRAMELRFGREFTPEPICISGGFRVTHVHRPFLGEAYLTKHGAKQPEIAFGPPEHGMLNILFGSPGPAFGSPEPMVLVATGLDKTQEIVVCDVMAINCKC